MFGQPKRGWIGVDLGEGAIKFAQLRRVGDRVRLDSACVSRRSGSSLLDDLRSAKALSPRLTGSRTAASLSMRDSLIEPTSEDQAIAEDHCSDSWQSGPESAYTLSTASEKVESSVDALARVGLQCEVIDGPPLALARILPLSPGYRPDAFLAALDWGETTATFVAATGGQAKYVRLIQDAGFSTIRREAAEHLGMSLTETERALSRFGLGDGLQATPEARFINDALRNSTRPIFGQLRRTLEHLGGKLKTKPPERVFLMGSAGVVPGLPAALERALGIPCEPWTAPIVERDPSAQQAPDCLLAQAIALSALVWEGNA